LFCIFPSVSFPLPLPSVFFSPSLLLCLSFCLAPSIPAVSLPLYRWSSVSPFCFFPCVSFCVSFHLSLLLCLFLSVSFPLSLSSVSPPNCLPYVSPHPKYEILDTKKNLEFRGIREVGITLSNETTSL
jgi:hypothetical protein